MNPTATILVRLARRTIPVCAMVYLTVGPAPAQQPPASGVLEYKGTVAAALEGEVAPRLDGLLSKIHFTPGQFVKKGDLLFEFATRNSELALALAQADQQQAEAQLRLAEVSLRNVQTLPSRSVASEKQLLEAEAQRDIAAAKAEQAGVNVQMAEIALSQMKLYAPISGVISRPFIREGAYISKEARDQTRLAIVVQLDPIHVVGHAPVDTYFQRGEKLTSLEQAAERREFSLVLPTGDTYPHKGRLVAASYEFNPTTQTVDVIAEFPNPNYLLRPGLNVTLQSAVRRE